MGSRGRHCVLFIVAALIGALLIVMAAIHPRTRLYSKDSLEWLVSRANRKPTVVTAMDFGYRFLGSNFLCNLRRLDLQKETIVVTTDREITKFLSRYFPDFRAIPLDELEHVQRDRQATLADPTDIKLYGSEGFQKVARAKVDAALGVMSLFPNQDIVFSDPDITWCNNAVKRLLSVVQERVGSDTSSPDLYFGPDPPNGYLNSGFYYARNTPKLRDFLLAFKDEGGGDDQTTFRRILCDKHQVEGGCLNDQDIRVHFIDNDVFSNGKAPHRGKTLLEFSRDTIKEECNVESNRATIHWNYMGGAQKESRMKGGGVWFLNRTLLQSDQESSKVGEAPNLCMDRPL